MFQSLHFMISSLYSARKILSLATSFLYIYREVLFVFPKLSFNTRAFISFVYKDLILKGSHQNFFFRLVFPGPLNRSSPLLCLPEQPAHSRSRLSLLRYHLQNVCEASEWGRGRTVLAAARAAAASPVHGPPSVLTE